MKLRKRIAALGAAMTMAVSMMNIGASAEEKSWNVHYNTSLPTSANHFLDKNSFYYNGRALNRYTDYVSYFKFTTNPNTPTTVYLQGYLSNQDGSGMLGVSFSDMSYVADNKKDNNPQKPRTHIKCPVTLKTPVLASKKLVVTHRLKDAVYTVNAYGKGNAYSV